MAIPLVAEGAWPAGHLNPASSPLARPLRALWAAAGAAGVDPPVRPLEWTTAGVTAFYKKVQFNTINQILVDQTFQPKGSNPTERSTSTYTYTAWVSGTNYTGEYLGGAASRIVTGLHAIGPDFTRTAAEHLSGRLV